MIALFTACDPGMAFSSAPTGEIRFGIVNVRFCVPGIQDVREVTP